MTLQELVSKLLDMSTYGIHAHDEVQIDNGENRYRVDGVTRDTIGGKDVVVIEVTTEDF